MGQRRSLATVVTLAGTHTAVVTMRTCRSDASMRQLLLRRHRLAVVRLDGDYVSVEALALMCGMSHEVQWKVSGGYTRVVSQARRLGEQMKTVEHITSSATNFKPMSLFYDMQPEKITD